MAFAYAVALTGSIGTGKSTACTMLKLLGFRIIDADAVTHKLLDEKVDRLVAMFGEGAKKEGKADRRHIGGIVFADEKKRKELEGFIHPLIFEEIKRQSEAQDRFKKPYLIDIPLFFEKQSYPIERSIVVYAPQEVQLQRLMKRDGLSEEQARKRINVQLDIEKKKRMATYVIDNSKDIVHLQHECERIKQQLAHDFN